METGFGETKEENKATVPYAGNRFLTERPCGELLQMHTYQHI